MDQSSIRRLIGIAIASAIVASTQADDAFNDGPPRTAEATEGLSDWMGRIDGGRSLSTLSIPGTHDSAATRNGLSMGFAKCQSWGVAEQLQAGVRFLDVRCRHVRDGLRIHHGPVDQGLNFADVRDACRAFLAEYPSECVLMSVQEEHTSEDATRSFAETFATETKGDGRLWLVGRSMPTLAEAQGRIVLIDRVGTLGGLSWSSVRKQDDYTAAVEAKRRKIADHLAAAAAGPPETLFITFCSGTRPAEFLTPRRYASRTNSAALASIEELAADGPVRLGVVAADFPGLGLIRAVVESNGGG